MIDPFFFDRLMHAFTTANSTPLSQAAAQGADGQCAASATPQAPACRALREAGTVAAAAFRRDHPIQAGAPQADRHV